MCTRAIASRADRSRGFAHIPVFYIVINVIARFLLFRLNRTAKLSDTAAFFGRDKRRPRCRAFNASPPPSVIATHVSPGRFDISSRRDYQSRDVSVFLPAGIACRSAVAVYP